MKKLISYAVFLILLSNNLFADLNFHPLSSDTLVSSGNRIVIFDVAGGPLNYSRDAEDLIDGDLSNKVYYETSVDCGFIVTPTGSGVVRGLQLATAPDAPYRDPTAWALYGTDEGITTVTKSGTGTEQNWTPIASGTMALTAARSTWNDIIAVDSSVAYTSYKVIFTAPDASRQISEFQMFSLGGYEGWAAENGLGTALEDDDDDGRNNLLEYATNGDPDAAGDENPTLTKMSDSFAYSYDQRNDDPNLTFMLETRSDLTSGEWITSTIPAVVNSTDGAYSTVSHIIPTDQPEQTQLFIRLKIQSL